ncbi:MAG: tetratricopeptide repeat protein [Flavobacteriales bacterium]|nr:tetratricopeptide repeat protein [Flavobacteriales bacterium]
MKKQLILIFTAALCSLNVSSQAYFAYIKNGEKAYAAKDYKTAIEELTKVIDAKADHDKAWNLRGLSFEETNSMDRAVLDLKKATELEPKNAQYHFDLGRVLYKTGKLDESASAYGLAAENDKKMTSAYEQKAIVLIELKKFQEAVAATDGAIGTNKTSNLYYIKGVAQDSLMDFQNASNSFNRAVFYDSKNVKAHLGAAFTFSKLKDYEKSMTSLDKALALDANNIEALLVRVEINKEQNNSTKAIDDLTKIISLNPELPKYFAMRGEVYLKMSQHPNAIADYSKAIQLKSDDYMLYYQRAKAYEIALDYKSAIKDYESIKKYAPYDGTALKMLDEAKKRLYDLNKESNNPKLTILEPKLSASGELQVPKGTEKVKIKAKINDESNIEFIKVNGTDAFFDKDSLNPAFTFEINSADKEVSVSAFDVYQNGETFTYKVKETEVKAPEIKLMAPYASDNGMVYLDVESPTLYIEGVLSDESLIGKIMIDGTVASFATEELNPKFSANITIANKDNFKVYAEDIYGNSIEKTFTINRENIAILADNPMGKTWVVFIENADYKNFASLDGPTKDVTMMKSAFAKYKINNIVHKSNMTKSQLEKFFSIELRDLVRSNQVNSILVWYAGHGKFINETGYWVPVDAKRDEEFTYFNINNLKAAMQSYSKYITHTLVITDACESGPSFYQAMRSTPKEKNCNDWQATKFKSSQVFSSAGYELAVDNSQFTKTFAGTLAANPNSCIPIETIVNKVSSAVEKSGASQKPKFGKIAGLEDEDGTFFFIKK